MLPITDLHVHLRGTITEQMVASLAARHAVLPPVEVGSTSQPPWVDFPSFLEHYRLRSSVIRTPEDLGDVARAFFQESGQAGLQYVELQISPQHSKSVGADFLAELDVVSAEADFARDMFGLEVRVVATAVRHIGPSGAVAVAREIARLKHPIVVGFGLTGNEREFRPADFAESFAIAGDAGFGLTAHIGEWTGPEQVLEAVTSLRLDRVGHGLSAAGHQEALACLLSSGVTLEVCLTSNLALERVARIEEHPIKKFIEAGVACTLCTDDPGPFSTSIAQEVALATRAGLTPNDMIFCAQSGVDAAFCDEVTRQALGRALLVRSRLEC